MGRLNKMSDFIRYFIKKMAEGVVEVAYAAMLSMLKYLRDSGGG